MEWIVIILTFITVPFIIYQSIIITNQDEIIEKQNKLLKHQETIIGTYEQKEIKEA